MDFLPPFLGNIVIGGIGLPALAALIIWFLHQVGVPERYDLPVKFGVAAILSILVVTMHFFPQYDQTIVGIVAFLYQALLAYKSIVERISAKTTARARVLLAR